MSRDPYEEYRLRRVVNAGGTWAAYRQPVILPAFTPGPAAAKRSQVEAAR